MAQQKILLALLNSNGDCLYGTVVARQIKEINYPGCHLTWAVNSKCKQTLLLNPHVDELWEIPTAKSLTTKSEWRKFVTQAEQRKTKGDFDTIFYIQIIDKNLIRLNGEVRQSIYNNYPHQITVSNQPVLQLSETEINNVAKFAAQHNLNRFKHVILIECGPDSFRSTLNPNSVLHFAKEFTFFRNDIALILSSNKKINETNEQIIDGSTLTFRENAAITHFCDFFIGCSSGISWICTSTAAKPLPRIIVINEKMMLNTSMCDDHSKAALSTDNIIEMHESTSVLKNVKDALDLCLQGNFNVAKEKYHQQFHRKNFKYLYLVSKSSFSQMKFLFPIKALKTAIIIDGFHVNAVYQIIKSYFKLPFWVIGSFFKK